MSDYIKRSELFRIADVLEKNHGRGKFLDMDGLRYLASVIEAADVVPRKKNIGDTKNRIKQNPRKQRD